MRYKIVTILTAGAIGATSFALAGPALASTTAPVAATVATAATTQLERIKAALAGLVTDKTITQAQADKVAETLKSTDLGRGGPGGLGGPGRPGGPGGPGLAAAATTLKMTEADLRTALEGGKTLAAVAKEKSVSVDALVAALVKAEKAQIALEVKDGRLTRAKADELLKDVATRVTKHVNSTRPARPDHDSEAAPGTATPGSATASPAT